MTRSIAAAAIAALALGAAGAALAQAPAVPPAAPGAQSVEKTPVKDILAAHHDVIEKDFPELLAYLKDNPGMTDMVGGMSLREIEPESQGQLDDAKLAKIQADLNAAAKP